jgi:hypothetical protein
VVAVADAADADAVVVVGDVECCGGGVDARVRCAERERRDEDEEDDDVEDEVEEAGDAAAAADKYLDETGLLERCEFLRAAAELGLSSAGVSGGREWWAGSGAVAAAAAATMPCRCRGRGLGRSGYVRAAVPLQCRSPGLQIRRPSSRSYSSLRSRRRRRRRAPSGSTTRLRGRGEAAANW